MTEKQSPADSPLAALVALAVLPIAIYIAFWRIDWGSESLLQYVLPVVFCIAVPSLIGSITAAIGQTIRR